MFKGVWWRKFLCNNLTMGFLRKGLVICFAAVLISIIYKALEKDRLPLFVDGTVEPGFEDVITAFRSNFESGDVEHRESGSAFAAYYKGKRVVNLWGGYADYEASQPWREDSMSIVFSVTKGMAALCMAILVDRGHLDYEQKVAHYWPEFAQNDKENVTVKMLLHHEAGLAVIDTPITFNLLRDYDELGRVLARSPPIWEPGTTHGYHAFTFALYASQLLTRTDPQKRTMGKFFRDEVAKPFGIEFYIGLPKDLNYRVSRYFTDVMDLDGIRSFVRGMMDPTNRQINWDLMTGQSRAAELINNVAELMDFRQFNDPLNREVELPSASGIGTAESLAKVYGILANGGKAADGRQLVSEKLINLIHEGGTPILRDEMFGMLSKFSYGYMRTKYQEREMLGHPGFGGNNAYADKKYQLGVGFVTRYASPFGISDPRFVSVLDVLYKCIEKLEKR